MNIQSQNCNLIAAVKLQTSPEICDVINELLQELRIREHPVLDYENPDCRLDRIEYHKAEDIGGEMYGDESDNLYCFFQNASDSSCKAIKCQV